MKKLGKREQAILLDMVSPAPHGKYFAKRGHCPEHGRVFKVERRGKTLVFCKSKGRLLSPEILAQVPHVVPQTLRTKPGWFAGWYYLVGQKTPEAENEVRDGDPVAGH